MSRATSPDAVVSIHFVTAPDATSLKKSCDDDSSPIHNKQQVRARRRQQVEAMHAPPPRPRRQTTSNIQNAGAWRRSSSMPSHRRPNSCTPLTGGPNSTSGTKPQGARRGNMPLRTTSAKEPASQAQSSAAASLCSTPCSVVKPSALVADFQTMKTDSCGVYSHAVQLHSHASQLTDVVDTMEVLSVMDAQELLPRLTNLRVSISPDAMQTSDSADDAAAPRGDHQHDLNDFLSTQHNSSSSSPCAMLPGQPVAHQAPSAPFFEPEDSDDDNTAQCAPCGMLQEWLRGSDKEQLPMENSARSLVRPGSENSAALEYSARPLASTGNLTDRCLQSPQLPATPHSRTSPLGVSSIVGSPHTHFPSMAQSHLQGGPLSPIEGTCMSSAALYATDDSCILSEAQSVEEECSEAESVSESTADTPKELVRNTGGSAVRTSLTSDTTSSEDEDANISPYLHVSIPPFNDADDILCGGGGSAMTLDALAADLESKCGNGAHPAATATQKEGLVAQTRQDEAGAELRSPANTDGSSSPEVESTQVNARHVFAASAAVHADGEPVCAAKAQPPGDTEGHMVEPIDGVDTMPAWETAYSTATWEKPPNELIKHASDSTVHSDIDQVASLSTERQPSDMKVPTHPSCIVIYVMIWCPIVAGFSAECVLGARYSLCGGFGGVPNWC